MDDTENKGVLALEKDIAHSYLDTVSLIPGAENLLLSLDVDTETQKSYLKGNGLSLPLVLHIWHFHGSRQY